MTTINETVDQALRQAGLTQYAAQARPVVEALVAREQAITTTLIQGAVNDFDADAEDLRQTFEGLGMALPPQQAQAGQVMDQSTVNRLAALEEFARANGFRG